MSQYPPNIPTFRINDLGTQGIPIRTPATQTTSTLSSFCGNSPKSSRTVYSNPLSARWGLRDVLCKERFSTSDSTEEAETSSHLKHAENNNVNHRRRHDRLNIHHRRRRSVTDTSNINDTLCLEANPSSLTFVTGCSGRTCRISLLAASRVSCDRERVTL